VGPPPERAANIPALAQRREVEAARSACGLKVRLGVGSEELVRFAKLRSFPKPDDVAASIRLLRIRGRHRSAAPSRADRLAGVCQQPFPVTRNRIKDRPPVLRVGRSITPPALGAQSARSFTAHFGHLLLAPIVRERVVRERLNIGIHRHLVAMALPISGSAWQVTDYAGEFAPRTDAKRSFTLERPFFTRRASVQQKRLCLFVEVDRAYVEKERSDPFQRNPRCNSRVQYAFRGPERLVLLPPSPD
jgi:hypothetical protein